MDKKKIEIILVMFLAFLSGLLMFYLSLTTDYSKLVMPNTARGVWGFAIIGLPMAIIALYCSHLLKEKQIK